MTGRVAAGAINYDQESTATLGSFSPYKINQSQCAVLAARKRSSWFSLGAVIDHEFLKLVPRNGCLNRTPSLGNMPKKQKSSWSSDLFCPRNIFQQWQWEWLPRSKITALLLKNGNGRKKMMKTTRYHLRVLSTKTKLGDEHV